MKWNNKYIYNFIVEKLSNVKLKRKIIISFVVIVAIPILVIAFFLFYNLEMYLKDSTIKDHTYKLNTEHYKMVNNVSIMSNISQVIVENEELIKFITESDNMENYDFYELSSNVYKYLSSLQNNNQYISSINIFTENDKINEMWPFIYNKYRIDEQKWYSKLIDSNENISWTVYHSDHDIKSWYYRGKEDENLVVSLNSKIKDKEDNVIGILRVNMKIEDFLPIMITKSLNKYNSVFVYNKKTEEISGGELFAEDKMSTKDINEFFREIEKNLKGESGNFEKSDSRNKFIVLYKKAPISGCYIVDVISLNNLVTQIEKIKVYTILGTIIVVVILIIVIGFMTDIILKRLYVVIDSLKEIKNGNFNCDIPVYGEDEIGLLAHNFRRMINKIDSLIKESVRKEMATKEAEVKALKTQIDAHFLYNTLENIKMMAEVEGNYIVSDSLVALGDLMRYNTKWNNEHVLIKEELVHINNYISLMVLRYDYNINLKTSVNRELENISILKMIIQPLVENAVKHGIRKILNTREGNISIDIREKDEFIIISVSDDGIGMSEEKRTLLQHHVHENINIKFGLGLRNVCERIRLAYGDKAELYIESKLDKGTTMILSIPKI